ncbi:TMEM175 family protein [Nakamurella leprariae]|uniref:DUF1211 domain-containing protein n=1 Tax=Nakamurella leprariae TaxID=2803911 RepID=A0A939BWU2_9ACTN|nr:TMEM175 family protein [Nakamurella leprariae]MBM9467888.1 DUF1211 domain-containing protein [Nakamurella leprariae]
MTSDRRQRRTALAPLVGATLRAMGKERTRRTRRGWLTEKDNDRVGALTDGTVAIALTVLVLELPVPDGADSPGGLWSALQDHAREYVTFLFAFWLIAIFWVAHRQEFRRVRIATERVVWANFLYLAAVVLIPFSSQLLSGHGGNALAITVFAGNLLLVSVSLVLIQIAARADEVATAEGQQEWITSMVRSCVLIAIDVLVIAVSWIRPNVAELLFLVLIVNEPIARVIQRRILAGRVSDRRSVADDPTPPAG